MAVTEPLECPTRRESMRNRQEIQFYGLAIPRIFFQLLPSLEIGQFENLSSISPEIPVQSMCSCIVGYSIHSMYHGKYLKIQKSDFFSESKFGIQTYQKISGIENQLKYINTSPYKRGQLLEPTSYCVPHFFKGRVVSEKPISLTGSTTRETPCSRASK